jgi:hypothetical protein
MAYEILSDKKKTQVTQLVNTADGLKLQQYYPETTAEVTNIKAIAGVTGTNVQQALESIQGNINDITGGGTVTNVNGVKGAVNIAEGTNIGVTVEGQNITISTPAEENVINEVQLNGTKITPTGKKVNVQVTKATVGLSNVNNVAITQTQVDQIGTNTENITKAQEKADEAYTIAKGKTSSYTFDTYETMVAELKSAPKNKYNVGDNLYIRALNVPDYWVAEQLSTNTGTYGYYDISPLESDKTVLKDYQTKNLVTPINVSGTTKTTVESALQAINTLAGTNKTDIQSLDGALGTVQENVTKILNGETVVPKAAEATKAKNVDLAVTVTPDTTNGDKVSIGAGTGKKAEFNVVNAKKSATSDKLTTARKITVNVNSGKKSNNTTDILGTGNATFDGSADKSISVELGASGVTAGAYSAVQVNAKGIVTGGGNIVEFDTGTGQPSTNLAVGGLFFKIIG